MKVLYFMNHADHGGAFLALYDLLVEIKKNKEIEPIVVTGKKNKFNELLDEMNIENYYAPYKNFISSYKEPKSLFNILLKIRYFICKPIAIIKLNKKIDFNKIDIIHTNLDRIDIGAYFSKKYKIPHIWHIREHLDDDFEVTSIYKDYIKYMKKYPSTYVAISKSVKDKWIKRGIDESKIKLIYDGINIEKINIKNEKKDDKKIKMIFLGGYFKNKGQEFCIDSLSKVPLNDLENIHLEFYGNGDENYINYLNKKIKGYNLEKNIKINPYDENIYNKIKNYDVGINCSKAEGFGRITVEYMATGLCPVVSNTGANVELVNKNSGKIFVYGDQLDFANVIRNIINNKTEIKELQKNARKRAIKEFSMQTHAKNIIALYKEIISKGEYK